MAATIHELEKELIEVLKRLPSFSESGFSIFDIDDFQSKSSGSTLPVVGVLYQGAAPVGESGEPKYKVSSAKIVEVQFLIVVALDYGYTGQEDTKPLAYNLLDQIRTSLLGYSGVNTRPWRFVMERPEPEFSGDGVLFYTQVWQTSLPVIGTPNSI